jgi:WD40 repeat protein
MRQIDVVCRRFEADWRAGARPPFDCYLAEVPDQARSALRVELEALERELQQSEETVARGKPSRESEAPTMAPGEPPTHPIPGLDRQSIHEDATVAPGDQSTSDHEPGSTGEVAVPSLPRVRYFGDYEIIREIARGGMGVVYQARQVSLNRPVALKMILAGQLADEVDVRRFYTEAEAAANLDHPGIVPIYEVGQHEGQHYFSMGFVEGQSLSQRVAEGPLPSREAAALMVKVTLAIEYAHFRGVIHRDLKPGNILLDTNGQPRVTDFGLAKKLESDSGLTGSGQIMGTPSYMPPEQAGGNRGAVGPAADVYALGATLYALITGRPPFQASSAMDTVLMVVSEEPVPPRRLNATVARDLETICLKCLEKEPAKRYASAAALTEDLHHYLAGEPIVARPVARLERAVKWAGRRPAIAGLLGLVALVIALGLGGVLWQWRAAVEARNEAQARERDAREAQAKEKVQSDLARERLQDALTAQAKERLQTELAEQRLYDVRMNLIQRYWEDYNRGLLQQGLDELLPANEGGIDRRAFEWFYWQRKIAAGHATLKGSHASQVLSVVFSRDGHRLASASADRTIKVWDAATGREIRTLAGHTGPVLSIAFSPDGKRLASDSMDRTVKLWDAATGGVLITLKGRTAAAVGSVAFSPDGHRLASGSQDGGTVKVWDVATGRELLALKGHTNYVLSVAFSPDGHRLASAGADHTVKVWDAATGRPIHTLTAHTNDVLSVAFSPDGGRLASAGGDLTIKLWAVATGQEVRTLRGHTGWITSVAFSPDGKRLASTSQDGTVKVWDAATGQEVRTLKGHTRWALSAVFSPDGRRLASGGSEGTVKIWDDESGQETLTLKGGSVSVAFSPDGRRLAAGGRDHTMRVWDAGSGEEMLALKGHTQPVVGVAYGPDGDRLASAGWDEAVKVWDARTGQELLTLKGHASLVTSVAFSPDGKWIASASRDGTAKVWDARTGQEARTLKGHGAEVTSVTFSPDGKRLASAGWDCAVRVWDSAIGQEIRTFKGHSGSVFAVAFSPDGHRLASASSDETVRMWDVATGQEVRTLKGHTSWVYGVAFSPDGKRLASGAADRLVKVWDAATGLETLTLKGHGAMVTTVAFSPDGHRLASVGWDNAVKVWDARPMHDEPRTSRLAPR